MVVTLLIMIFFKAVKLSDSTATKEEEDKEAEVEMPQMLTHYRVKSESQP